MPAQPRSHAPARGELRTRHGGMNFGAATAAGLIAGIAAGAVMGMISMGRAYYAGLDVWMPVEQIAAVVYGEEAVLAGDYIPAVGLLIHMAVSAGAGWVFALMGGARLSSGAALFVGMVFGVVLWAAMTYLVLPAVNETMFAWTQMIPVWWFGYHLIYGAMLFLTPVLYRAFTSRRQTA